MENLRTLQDEPEELDLQEAQPSFAEELVHQPGCDTLPRCFQCGVCTGTCPVSEVDERFSPARIIQWIRMGLVDLVLSSPTIWYCLQCHRCSFHCPQGVRFADIDEALRHRAVEDGFISKDKVEALKRLELELRRNRIRLLDRVFGNEALEDPALEPETGALPTNGDDKSSHKASPAQGGVESEVERDKGPPALREESVENRETMVSSKEGPTPQAEQDIDLESNDEVEWETDDPDDSGPDSW